MTTSWKTLKRAWNFKYEHHKKSLEMLKLQLKTIKKIINVLKETTDIKNSFIENERKYMNYRISFTEQTQHFATYLYFSFKQNYCMDFIYTTAKDIIFALKTLYIRKNSKSEGKL